VVPQRQEVNYDPKAHFTIIFMPILGVVTNATRWQRIMPVVAVEVADAAAVVARCARLPP